MLTGWGSAIRQDDEKFPEVDVVMEKPPSVARLHESLLRVTNGKG